MKKISFICCYTKENLLYELKKSTACLSDYEIEWIAIDNRNDRFTSAASALNYGFRESSFNIVVFLHQDIVLYDQLTIDRVVDAAEQGNIVGFAGRRANGGEMVSTLITGEDEKFTYAFDFGDSDRIKVSTCDECFMAMSRETFELLGAFDEKNFDGWHFYGVDFSLRAAKKHIPVLVVRANAWHRSRGNWDKNFNKYKNILRKKYKKEYKIIHYPCGWTYTSTIKYYGNQLLRSIIGYPSSGKKNRLYHRL
ncbi:MAG: glycosyltransferase family protein [Lachnospiraceae bacterium]|nr:glycosyltransferase family protein [Lachnospiraceae bacterium]